MLYKYRPLTNFEFLIDALVNQRLYAAPFTALNDPMEGAFRSEKRLTNQDLMRIAGLKAEYRILSLSTQANNSLMWSYYADSHRGVAIGVQPQAGVGEVEAVNYVDDLAIEEIDSLDIARALLIRKYGPWKHESEVRVITRHTGEFVPVTVQQVVFGLKTPDHYQNLIRRVAKAFNPGVKFTQMTERKLNHGKSYHRPVPNN